MDRGHPESAGTAAVSSIQPKQREAKQAAEAAQHRLGYFVTFFLPAIATALPLRVRALVWVR